MHLVSDGGHLLPDTRSGVYFAQNGEFETLAMSIYSLEFVEISAIFAEIRF
jgi:hypothetical protein